MSIVAPARKPLGVRATAEQHRILTEAAAREHRSVSSYVLSAALKAAEMFRKSSASGRDLLEELFAERRADAARG
jgi:uncharacterized protein (DUF1778 family)